LIRLKPLGKKPFNLPIESGKKPKKPKTPQSHKSMMLRMLTEAGYKLKGTKKY
jgi:hypothetical protein